VCGNIVPEHTYNEYSILVSKSGMTYDGAIGDPLLYFKHVTQFVEAVKTHALRMNKKEIWYPCKNCENNVLISRANVMQGSTPKAFANDLSHL
jgi:hypothetical protein